MRRLYRRRSHDLGDATFSAIHEPLNHYRRVVGFDTFAGFPSIADQDQGQSTLKELQVGGLFADTYDEITECAETFDFGRPLGHIPKIQLVRRDACQTLPQFIEQNQHFVCSLLYLDFDIYEPTKVALETMLPRMPKGAIIAFDEVNVAEWPGETRAVLDVVGLKNLRIQRVPYSSAISYAVI